MYARFTGKVIRTSSALSNSNRTLRTEIDLPNAEGKLLPGMYVLAEVTVEERPEVLALPTTAIAKDGAGQASCFIVESGKLYRRSIQVGLEAAPLVEIVSGLSGDEAVVKIQNPTLVEGQPAESVPGS
jgi:multidrug efflux pump subunit AcrA (membrane-fusion protein)